MESVMPCLPSANRLMLWVRPGVLEAKASRFCWVRVLMQVDLPALERPTKAISGTSRAGRCSSRGAVVRKRAVCSQETACAAAGEVVIGGGERAECGIVESLGFAQSKPKKRDQDARFPAAGRRAGCFRAPDLGPAAGRQRASAGRQRRACSPAAGA